LLPSHRDVEALNRTLESRNAELQEANNELESFSYSVSHDLGAPLRHLAGFSKLLQEEYTANLDETARHYVRVIQKDAKNMGELVDGLLDMGRLVKCPRLLYQCQCKFSIDVSAGMRSGAGDGV